MGVAYFSASFLFPAEFLVEKSDSVGRAGSFVLGQVVLQFAWPYAREGVVCVGWRVLHGDVVEDVAVTALPRTL